MATLKIPSSLGTSNSSALTSTSTSNAWGLGNIINTPNYTHNTFPNIILQGQLIHDLCEDIIGKSFQHEIAVIKVTRNQDGKIIRSKMIKTFWVETLSQGSIEYAASKDKDVAKFEPEEIIIKTLRTIKL